MQAQNDQNNILVKITENHGNIIGKLSNQEVSISNDVQALQERTKIVEAQLGKIVESQTLILARLTGKPETNLVEYLKMMRVKNKDDKPEELDYSNTPSQDYTVEDLLKMIIVKNPGIKKVMMFMYQQFIKEVSSKVRELEMEYKRLAGKLSAKFDDIKIKI
jgi:hypothetical protein